MRVIEGPRRRSISTERIGIVGIGVMTDTEGIITGSGTSSNRRNERGRKIKRRSRMACFRLRSPCHLYKYPCLLFLEKDANAKDQDPLLTTTAGIRTTTKANSGTPSPGCQGWTTPQQSRPALWPTPKKCEDSWSQTCPTRSASPRTTYVILLLDLWLKIT